MYFLSLQFVFVSSFHVSSFQVSWSMVWNFSSQISLVCLHKSVQRLCLDHTVPEFKNKTLGFFFSQVVKWTKLFGLFGWNLFFFFFPFLSGFWEICVETPKNAHCEIRTPDLRSHTTACVCLERLLFNQWEGRILVFLHHHAKCTPDGMVIHTPVLWHKQMQMRCPCPNETFISIYCPTGSTNRHRQICSYQGKLSTSRAGTAVAMFPSMRKFWSW